MALELAADYIVSARELLQDEVTPYRYPEADFLRAIETGLLEIRRLRPDLFIGRFGTVLDVPSANTPIVLDTQYRSALLYYVAGRVELRDSEDSKDARASVLLNKFIGQLTTMQA